MGQGSKILWLVGDHMPAPMGSGTQEKEMQQLFHETKTVCPSVLARNILRIFL